MNAEERASKYLSNNGVPRFTATQLYTLKAEFEAHEQRTREAIRDVLKRRAESLFNSGDNVIAESFGWAAEIAMTTKIK